jgi:hypothetical protein
MTLYTDVAGVQTQTTIPILPNKGPGLFDKRSARSWTPSKTARPPRCLRTRILINQAIIDAIGQSAQLHREIEVVIPEI